MTTKEQERDALNRIREILGTLDADGWMNMAFRGVCDIAENNIRDDFGCSPVERVEELDRQLVEYRKELVEIRKELETAKVEIRNRESEIKNREADIVHLSAKLERREKDISEAETKHLRQKELLENIERKLEAGLEGLNTTILEYCENPESQEFKDAVSSRRETMQLLKLLVDAM